MNWVWWVAAVCGIVSSSSISQILFVFCCSQNYNSYNLAKTTVACQWIQLPVTAARRWLISGVGWFFRPLWACQLCLLHACSDVQPSRTSTSCHCQRQGRSGLVGHPKTTKVGAVLSWLKTGVLTHHMFNCSEMVCQMFRVLGILGIILLNVHGVRRLIRGKGKKSEDSRHSPDWKTKDAVDRHQNMGMLRQCLLSITQQLMYYAVVVPTTMRNRVTKTMSVALPLGNNWNKRNPTFKPSSTFLLLISSGISWEYFRWCLMSSDVGWCIRDKLRPMHECVSIVLYIHGNHEAQ